MNKPRSYASPSPGRRYRERTYPFVLSSHKTCFSAGFDECEACKKDAQHCIVYESSKDATETSTIYLCHDHEKLTRYGKFDQVFRDMNRKIDRGSK